MCFCAVRTCLSESDERVPQQAKVHVGDFLINTCCVLNMLFIMFHADFIISLEFFYKYFILVV